MSYASFDAGLERLLGPFHGPNQSTSSRGTLFRQLPGAWRSLEPFGQLRLSVNNANNVVAIDEVRCAPTALALTDWQSPESAVAITLYSIRVGPRSVSSEKVKVLGIVGQHALARRFEHGRDRGNVAVMRDLIPLVSAWPRTIRVPGNFEVGTGSGNWRGEVVPLVLNGEAMTLMNVRTFVD